VCTIELIHLLHYIAADVDINALACFDMMIEACQNLSCMSLAPTLNTSSYMVKHIVTPSTTQNTPLVSLLSSTGTLTKTCGTEWEKAQVMPLSDGHSYPTCSSFAYQLIATSWYIKSIIHNLLITLGIDTFVNDTNMIHSDVGNTNIHKLI